MNIDLIVEKEKKNIPSYQKRGNEIINGDRNLKYIEEEEEYIQ